MKRNLKRLPAMLLSVILCLSLLPATAGALEISGADWEFDLTDMTKPTLIIKSDEGMDDWIENGGSYRSIVLAVELSEGIAETLYHAFYTCSNLPTVTTPATVTRTGNHGLYEPYKNLSPITGAAAPSPFTPLAADPSNADDTTTILLPPR